MKDESTPWKPVPHGNCVGHHNRITSSMCYRCNITWQVAWDANFLPHYLPASLSQKGRTYCLYL